MTAFAALVEELADGRPVRRSRPGGKRTYAVIAERWYLDVSERGLYAGGGQFKRGPVGTPPPELVGRLEAAGLSVVRFPGTLFAGRAAGLDPGSAEAREHCRACWAAVAPLVEWLDGLSR